MAGVDFPAVKELMAHKDITMTLHYTHLSSACKQRAVRGLTWGGEKVPAIQQIIPGMLLCCHKHLLFQAGPLAQLAEQRTLNP